MEKKREIIAELIKKTYYEKEVKRILAIKKETNIDEAEAIYTVWTGDSEKTLECQCEWDLGVKLNKEQAAESQKYNMKSWWHLPTSGGQIEVLTEGYYIVERDRGGDWYYKVENEKDLVEVLLKYYRNWIDETTDVE